MHFSVKVPASSANLGSGFDTLAIALDLSMTVEVEATGGDSVEVLHGPDLFGGENLVEFGIRAVAEELGRPVPGCRLWVTSDIPVARGLGSSASALVAGLAAGNQLFDQALTNESLLEIATRIEGHGDNVSASLYGGITMAIWSGDSVIFRRVPVAGALRTVVFIPEQLGLTVDARAVVPELVPRADAIANVGRAALLTLGFVTGEFAVLGEAMRDRLHQPYREALFPFVPTLIDASLRAGAYGACLSGAGPSVLALVSPERADDVLAEQERVAASLGLTGCARVVDVAWAGTGVTTIVPQRV